MIGCAKNMCDVSGVCVCVRMNSSSVAWKCHITIDRHTSQERHIALMWRRVMTRQPRPLLLAFSQKTTINHPMRDVPSLSLVVLCRRVRHPTYPTYRRHDRMGRLRVRNRLRTMFDGWWMALRLSHPSNEDSSFPRPRL